MQGRVYLVTNSLNGKQYVGQTITKHSRKGHGHALADAYKKYGHKSFTYETICSGIDNHATLDFAEQFWINVMSSLAPNGYNLESGGRRYKTVSHKPQLGIPHTEETKAKMSEGQKRYLAGIDVHFNVGRKHSEETKIKMSTKRTGRKQSDEERKMRSESMKQWHKSRKENS
jgi:group I intron endonuclease